MTTILSTSGRWSQCVWCVTTTRVLLPRNSGDSKQFSRRCVATCASTAANMSSRMTTSLLAYTALARATRVFWPPERFNPRSPISVRSPPGSILMSGARAHASRTASYL
mmetsp:Transcript_56628/g.77191  ORF Transcript_56628/g.77191 Transcript_56628/m.77191 type:complete len:109 (+) Transcript_56628:2521-2847(+)